MDNTNTVLAKAIVKQFYPEMPDNYEGRRVQIALAALRQPTQTDANELLREAKLALEYCAGCDEGIEENEAEGMILSWAGSPAAVSYANICAHLAALEASNG